MCSWIKHSDENQRKNHQIAGKVIDFERVRRRSATKISLLL